MQTQTQMSITQALSELKLLDARINRAIHGGSFCAGYMNNTKINAKLTPAEAEAIIRSSWQSVNDLIKRRAIIKSKIVESNARTIVQIGTTSMTVAEAIERKNSITYERSLLAKITNDFKQASATVIQGNEVAREKAQASLDSVLGKEGAKTPGKEEIAAIYDPVFQRYEYKLLDPLNLDEIAKELDERIGNFETNVDFALSTSNATTVINIE